MIEVGSIVIEIDDTMMVMTLEGIDEEIPITITMMTGWMKSNPIVEKTMTMIKLWKNEA